MPRTTTALGTSLGGLLKGVQAGRQGAATGDHQAVQDAYMMAQMDNLRAGGANKSAEVAAKTARSNEQQAFNADDERQYGSALEMNGLSSALAKGVADYYKNPTPGKFKTSVDMPEITGLPAAAPITASYEQEAPGGLTPAQLSGVQRTKGVLGAQYRLTGDTNAQQLTKSMMDLLGRQDAEGIYADPSLAQGVNTAAAAAAGKLYDNGRDPGTVLSQGTGQLAIGNQPVYDAGIAKTRSETAENNAQAQAARDGVGKAPAGYRWAATGQLEPIPGGPADPASKSQNKGAPSEDERKAAGWVSQAQKAYDDMVSATEEDASASSPGIVESLPLLPEAAKNYTRSPERQRFNQAASAFSEATLRAATGAGVNESEAKQKIAELTPQLGDSKDVIEQKKASMQMYLDSLRLRAGRALPENQQQPTDAPAQRPVRNITAAADFLRGKKIKTQEQAKAAVAELQQKGWSRPEIEAALDRAGL